MPAFPAVATDSTAPHISPAVERFRFVWDGAAIGFADASGLEMDAESVTLSQGHFLSNTSFWRWFNRIKASTMQRSALTILQCNEAGVPVYRWTLHDACPTLAIGESGADDELPRLSSLVLAHQGVSGSPA